MKTRIALVLLIAVFLAGCSAGGWSLKQDAKAQAIECLCAANLGYFVGAKTNFPDVAAKYATQIREVIKTGDPNQIVQVLIQEGLAELAARTSADPFIMMNANEVVALFEFKPVDGSTWSDAEKLALYDKLIARFLAGLEFGKLKRAQG